MESFMDSQVLVPSPPKEPKPERPHAKSQAKEAAKGILYTE